ncbi:hypothetical protein HWV62_10859 [Athelia sp. TMB]|nr:hypothetical protein HWV62_10859 [Athelia sp. TMB]
MIGLAGNIPISFFGTGIWAWQNTGNLTLNLTLCPCTPASLGVYSTGPFLGRFADKHGPRQIMVAAFFFLMAGYLGIRAIFLNPLTAHPDLMLALLIGCAWMTGAGGNGGLVSSVNATAKSFPDAARATATGMVLSGFGLSAFVFGTLSHTLYKGDTGSFLLLLGLGTSAPMVLGFFCVRRVPLPSGTYEPLGAAEYGVIVSPEEEEEPESVVASGAETPLLGDPVRAENSLELSPPADLSGRALARSLSRPSFSDATRPAMDEVNIHGRALLADADFWILVVVMSLLSGTGIMYINNVGSIAQALVAHGNPAYDPEVAAQWQAAQVSAISITNFSGRVLIGMLSDYISSHRRPRSYATPLICFLFIVSQLLAMGTTDVTELWKASLALGLAYGGMFGLLPMVCIEWFGLSHFSENWGILCLSPLIGGNLFSLAFGRNLDAHAPSVPSAPSSPASLFNATASPLPNVSDEPQCLDGRACYVASLQMTTLACCLALALAVWAALRDRRKMAHVGGKAQEEAVEWEET